jgi:hypothetical protein
LPDSIVQSHALPVVWGLVVVAVGLILLLVPQSLVAVGSRYRVWLSTVPRAASVRAARIAAIVLVLVGLVVIAVG